MKNTNKFLVAAICFFCLVIEFIFIFANSDSYELDISVYSEGNIVGTITAEAPLEQTFVSENNGLSRVEVLLANYGRVNQSNVTIEIIADDGSCVYSSTLAAESIADNSYFPIDFEPIADSKGHTYTIKVLSDTNDPNNAITAWASYNDNYASGALLRNGADAGFDVAFNAIYKVNSYTLMSLPIIIMILSGVLIALCPSCLYKKGNKNSLDVKITCFAMSFVTLAMVFLSISLGVSIIIKICVAILLLLLLLFFLYRILDWHIVTSMKKNIIKTSAKLNKMKVIIFSVALLIWLITLILNINSNLSLKEDKFDILVSNTSSYGYSIENDTYTNIEESGNANIQLPDINQYVENIKINFSQPLPQPLKITVYYAESDHDYSDSYTSSLDCQAGSVNALIPIGKEIITCRVDIGSVQGESFSLDSIVINDSEPIIRNQKLNNFRTVILFLIILVIIVAAFIIFTFQLPKENIFAALTLIAGCFYLFTMTPISIPDEQYHHFTTYKLSNYLLLHLDDPDKGDSKDLDYSGCAGHFNVSSAYLRLIDGDGEKLLVPSEKIDIPHLDALKYFIQYLSPAIGISLGRILNLPFMQLFLLGRFFNLLFFTICVYFAVKRTPQFKNLFGLIALMPMSLHQAASYSYDCFINGISFVLISSLLKAIYEEGAISKKDIAWIIVSGSLLAPAKVVYCPILLLALLIPRERFTSKKRKIITVLLIYLVCFLFMLIFMGSNLISFLSSNLEETSDTINYAGGHNYTIGFILKNPLETLEIFWNTYKAYYGWFYQSLGSILAGYSLIVPGWIFSILVFNALVSALSCDDSKFKLTNLNRLIFVLIYIIVVILVMFSMFTGWTSDTLTIIQGVQGRYLIPTLPLLFMTLNNQTMVLKKDIYGLNIIVSFAMNYAVIDHVITHTIVFC